MGRARLQAQVQLVMGELIDLGGQQEVGAAGLERAAEGRAPRQRAREVGAALLGAARDQLHARRLLAEAHAARACQKPWIGTLGQTGSPTRVFRSGFSTGVDTGCSASSVVTCHVFRAEQPLQDWAEQVPE